MTTPHAPQTPSLRVYTLICLCILALVSSLACAPQDTDPDLPEPDHAPSDIDSDLGKAGTGSAGGNPLTFAFESKDSSSHPQLLWTQPIFHIGSISVVDPNPDTGLCDPNNTTPTRSISVQDSFTTDDLTDLLSIPSPKPCSFTVYPTRNIPLLSVQGNLSSSLFDLTIPLDITYTLPSGIVFDISQSPNLPNMRKAFIITNLDDLLRNIDLSDLLRNLSTLDLSDTEESNLSSILRTNLAPALQVYVDPTPGDGTLSEDERTETNRLATISIPTQNTPSDALKEEKANKD